MGPIHFVTAFHRVNHLALLHKLLSVGVAQSLFSMLGQILLNCIHCGVVDGKKSAPMVVASGLLRSRVLGPLLFLLHTSDMFSVTYARLNLQQE